MCDRADIYGCLGHRQTAKPNKEDQGPGAYVKQAHYVAGQGCPLAVLEERDRGPRCNEILRGAGATNTGTVFYFSLPQTLEPFGGF